MWCVTCFEKHNKGKHNSNNYYKVPVYCIFLFSQILESSDATVRRVQASLAEGQTQRTHIQLEQPTLISKHMGRITLNLLLADIIVRCIAKIPSCKTMGVPAFDVFPVAEAGLCRNREPEKMSLGSEILYRPVTKLCYSGSLVCHEPPRGHEHTCFYCVPLLLLF